MPALDAWTPDGWAPSPWQEAVRERDEFARCVVDMCALLDIAGQRFQFDPDRDEGAYNYFSTVSKNIGMARVMSERLIGEDYYDERLAHYAAAHVCNVRAALEKP
jgi:hypothetical protein